MKFSLHRPRAVVRCLVALAALASMSALCLAGGFNNGFNNNNVGGVSIDADGVLDEAATADVEGQREIMLQRVRAAQPAMAEQTELRMISLRGLEQAIRDAQQNDRGILPEEVMYLGGLQRIQYVFVYPETNDIVLAGPGEGWKVDAAGNVVGETTNRPVIQLDDLIVALRSSEAARQGAITCSIEPTAEGRQNLRDYLSHQTQFHQGIPAGVEAALGPQQIILNGVDPTSHFARVLVAADYKMKRLAMGLDESPVPGLGSYLAMLRSPRGDMMPRWWMACDYDTLARTEDGLAWELRGQGVKTMTEDDFVNENGEVEGTGQANPLAQRWADQMTGVYDELCQHEAVFGELRNIMDMCVIAAIIDRENLCERAGCELPILMGAESELQPHAWNAPQSVATQCSFTRVGSEFVITASGGVEISSWAAAADNEVVAETAELREQAAPVESGNWWWNASS